jgi:hypothetical protein
MHVRCQPQEVCLDAGVESNQALPDYLTLMRLSTPKRLEPSVLGLKAWCWTSRPSTRNGAGSLALQPHASAEEPLYWVV